MGLTVWGSRLKVWKIQGQREGGSPQNMDQIHGGVKPDTSQMATQKGHTFNVGRNRTSLNLIVSSSTRGSEPKLWFGNLADPVEQRGIRSQHPVFVGCNCSRLLIVTGCCFTGSRDRKKHGTKKNGNGTKRSKRPLGQEKLHSGQKKTNGTKNTHWQNKESFFLVCSVLGFSCLFFCRMGGGP